MANRSNLRRKGRYATNEKNEHARIKMVDDIAEYERFREQVLPALRKDLNNGLSAEEIYAKYQSLAAARGLTIAMTEPNAAVAMAAIKDVLDRTAGRAPQKVEIKGHLQKMSDDDLDAMIMSKLGTENEDEEIDKKH